MAQSTSTASTPRRCCTQWQRWTADLPETVNTSICIQQLPPLPGVPEPLAGRMTVAVRYTAVGDFAEAQRLLQPMRDVAPVLIDAVGVLPYAAIGAVHADPVDPMPVHEDHALLRELTAETVDAILAACGPGSDSPQTIVELRLLGGALAREPRHRSAFCHRNAAYALSVIGVLAPPVGRGRRRARRRAGRRDGAVVDGRAAAELRGVDRSRPARALLQRGRSALAEGARATLRSGRRNALSTRFGAYAGLLGNLVFTRSRGGAAR